MHWKMIVASVLVVAIGCESRDAASSNVKEKNEMQAEKHKTAKVSPLTRHYKACNNLRALGANVREYTVSGEKVTSVDLASNWVGTSNDLRLLEGLQNIRELFLGPRVSINELVKIDSLQSLRYISVSESEKSKKELKPLYRRFKDTIIYDCRDRVRELERSPRPKSSDKETI